MMVKILVTFLSVVIIDQLSKILVLKFDLYPVYYNNLVAFSLPIPWYIPWVVLVLIGVYYLLKYRESGLKREISEILSVPYINTSLPLIAGGGISNIIDRLFHNGGVIDFIDLHYWPVFNLADSAIVIGVILIIYQLYKQRGV